MGNKQCSEYDYINSGYNSNHHRARSASHKNTHVIRTDPNLEGALTRLIGSGNSKRVMKEIQNREAMKNRGGSVSNQPSEYYVYTPGNDNLQGPVHGNPNPRQPIVYGMNQLNPKKQPQARPQTRPQVQDMPVPINQARPAPKRRIDLNIEKDEDLLAVCTYCNDSVILQFYQDHINQCVHNPKNKKVSCEYCGEPFAPTRIRAHQKNCDSRIENLKIQCRHCNESISLADEHYHDKTCVFNPVNMVPSQPNKVPLAESSSNKIQASQKKSMALSLKSQVSQVNQGEECTICLVDIKKNSKDIRFLPCTHKFHRGCIEDWSKKQKKCPVCLTDFD